MVCCERFVWDAEGYRNVTQNTNLLRSTSYQHSLTKLILSRSGWQSGPFRVTSNTELYPHLDAGRSVRNGLFSRGQRSLKQWYTCVVTTQSIPLLRCATSILEADIESHSCTCRTDSSPTFEPADLQLFVAEVPIRSFPQSVNVVQPGRKLDGAVPVLFQMICSVRHEMTVVYGHLI